VVHFVDIGTICGLDKGKIGFQ